MANLFWGLASSALARFTSSLMVSPLTATLVPECLNVRVTKCDSCDHRDCTGLHFNTVHEYRPVSGARAAEAGGMAVSGPFPPVDAAWAFADLPPF